MKIFTCNIEFQIGSEMKRKLHEDYIGDWFRAGGKAINLYEQLMCFSWMLKYIKINFQIVHTATPNQTNRTTVCASNTADMKCVPLERLKVDCLCYFDSLFCSVRVVYTYVYGWLLLSFRIYAKLLLSILRVILLDRVRGKYIAFCWH